MHEQRVDTLPAAPTLPEVLHARIAEYTSVLTNADSHVRRAALLALIRELTTMAKRLKRDDERSQWETLMTGGQV